MIGWTRVRKQPIIALYFELEIVLKFYNLEACSSEVVANSAWYDKHVLNELVSSDNLEQHFIYYFQLKLCLRDPILNQRS